MIAQTGLHRFALAAALVVAGACDSQNDGPPEGITGSTGPLVMGLSRQFSVDFPGVPVDSVAWSVVGDVQAGTIDSTGRYTAGVAEGTSEIVATAMADSTVTDTTHVTVVPYATPTPLGLPGYGIAIDPSSLIAAADNNSTLRFRTTGGATIAVGLPNEPVHVAFTPGGTSAFAVTLGGTLYRIAVGSWAVVDTQTFGRPLWNLAVRSTDSVVYVTTQDGWLFKVAPSSLTPLDSVRLASPSNGLAFAPGGGTLWVSTIDTGRVYRIDPTSLAKVDSFALGAGTQRLAVAPSGDSVYVANQWSQRVIVIRPSTRTVTWISLQYDPHGVGISTDGSRLFIAQVNGFRVSVFDRRTMTLLGAVPVGGWPRNVVAVPGSSAMLVSTEGDVVRIQ